MTKEEFLKQMKKNLRFLPRKARAEQLVYFENLDNYNLDPEVEANKIYEKFNFKARIFKITLKEALNNIIDAFRSKRKELIRNVILFFLYLLLLVILIKVPFIYLRDIVVSLFFDVFKNDNIYSLYSFGLDILYTITTILIFIRLLKKKGYQLRLLENAD